MNKKEKFLTCFVIGIIVGAMEALAAWIFMLAWNWAMPNIFNLPVINFWTALGAFILLQFVALAFRRPASK